MFQHIKRRRGKLDFILFFHPKFGVKKMNSTVSIEMVKTITVKHIVQFKEFAETQY